MALNTIIKAALLFISVGAPLLSSTPAFAKPVATTPALPKMSNPVFVGVSWSDFLEERWRRDET
ncbi:MAG: hypothetical protein V4805_12690, partial [Pseudomonadota bacterium]